MQPVDFPQMTDKLGKGQPEYRILPAYISEPDEQGVKQYTFKYELSDLEIQQIIKTKGFYFSQFGSHFHPVLPQLECPFGFCPVQYKNNEDGTYTFWIPLDNNTVEILNNIPLENAVIEVMSWGNLKAEQIIFVEKPELSIDENGNIIDIV
jgi:hypothetical protein